MAATYIRLHPEFFKSHISYCRPQRSCGKVMFSQASVILFIGGCLLDTPGQTPPPPPSPADGYCSGIYFQEIYVQKLLFYTCHVEYNFS